MASIEAPTLPATPYNYAAVDLPSAFATDFVRGLDNTPASNPTTDHGATLGRVLFYDRTLSANGAIACASCHVQSLGFADPAYFARFMRRETGLAPTRLRELGRRGGG